MIQTFIAQINDLQTEIKSLAKTQLDMSAVIQKQQSELRNEKKQKDQLKKKYKVIIVNPLSLYCFRCSFRLENLHKLALVLSNTK